MLVTIIIMPQDMHMSMLQVALYFLHRKVYLLSLSALKVSVLSGDLSPGWVNLHPGEMGHFFSGSLGQIQSDLYSLIYCIAQNFDGYLAS